MPYSNDGLHLTTAGYQKMADLLYDEVFRNYMLDQNETEAAVIQAIDDRQFDRVVETARVPVLVEFWQPGCGGCRALLIELEKLAAECGERLLILKMNVQENYQIPAELEISSLPGPRPVQERTVRSVHRRRRKKRRYFAANSSALGRFLSFLSIAVHLTPAE